MELREEGEGEVVACAEDDVVDVAELFPGFEGQG